MEHSAIGATEFATLTWGVFGRFNTYINNLLDGEVHVSDGAEIADDGFRFPLARYSAFDPEAGSGSIFFGGTVLYRGHHGMLRVTISNPAIEFVFGRPVLTVGPEGSPARSILAELGTMVRMPGSPATARCEARLHADKTVLFNSAYPAGTRLDPLYLRAATE